MDESLKESLKEKLQVCMDINFTDDVFIVNNDNKSNSVADNVDELTIINVMDKNFNLNLTNEDKVVIQDSMLEMMNILKLSYNKNDDKIENKSINTFIERTD